MNTALGRTEIALLTNKSGGSVAQGDVVIVDTANASAFTTTTSSAYVSGRVGVVLEPNGIANNGTGLVAFGGYVPVINLSGTGSIGDLVKTHTVAKQGVRHAAPQVAGDFAQVLGTTATPAALLFGTVQLGAGSGGGGRTLLDTQSPSSTGTVTFSSISGSYTHLEIVFVARSTRAAQTNDPMKFFFNNDTTDANYRRIQHYGYGTTTAGSDGADDRYLSNIPAASSPANSPSSGVIHIPYYKDTTFYKNAIVQLTERRDASSLFLLIMNYGKEWENTAAITRIDLVLDNGNFVSGSTFKLYGLD